MADKDVLTVKIAGETDVEVAADRAARALADLIKEQQRASAEAARMYREELARRKEAERATEEFRRKVEDVGRSIVGAFGISLGLQEVLQFLGEGKQLFLDWEKSGLRLEAIVKATGQAAGFSAAGLRGMAERFEKRMPMFGAGQFEGAQAALATYTGVKGQTYEEAIRLSADLAAVMGGDLAGAAQMLGKALESPEDGLQALRRAGIVFTEQERAQIAAMAELGHVAEAQQAILDKLRGTVGGVAEEMGKGKAGQLEAWRSEIETFKRELGELWVGFEAAGVQAIREVINAMKGGGEGGLKTGKGEQPMYPHGAELPGPWEWVAQYLSGQTGEAAIAEWNARNPISIPKGMRSPQQTAQRLEMYQGKWSLKPEEALAGPELPRREMRLDIAGVIAGADQAMQDWVALMKLDAGAVQEVLKGLGNTHEATLAQIRIKEEELKQKSPDLARQYGEAARRNLQEQMEAMAAAQQSAIAKMKFGLSAESEQLAIREMMAETAKIQDQAIRDEMRELRRKEIAHQFRPEEEGTEAQRQQVALRRGRRLMGMWEQEQAAMEAQVRPIESLWLRRAGKAAEETRPPTAEQFDRMIKLMEDEDEKAQKRLKSAIEAVERTGTFSRVPSIYGVQVGG